jgi:ribosomal protein S18 acetylase RimI-like enzyme
MQDDTIRIRDTTPEDIPRMRAMHGQSWRDTYPNDEHGVSKEFIEKRTADWVTPENLEKSKEFFKGIIGNPRHFHQIAVRGDEIVGIVHASKTDEGQTLEALYVDKKYHGNGLARQMIEKALAWCDTGRPIDLDVVAYNERAKAFYQKYGFREKPGTEKMFAEVIPTITMEREGDK